MNALSGGFGVSLIQRRGALLPDSPPQTVCDACRAPLKPEDATEVTVTTPRTTTRLYGHGRCAEQLAQLVAHQVG